MVEKKFARTHLSAGIAIRSGLTSGRTMCYQEVNGIWYPMIDPNNPPFPTPPVPTPPNPNIQWLSCQSCQGARISDRALQNAKCEVCRM
jgi:hypothetical protein